MIIREHDGQRQVCLIARQTDAGLIWALPKGHVEAGEDLLTTALREVREETGLDGELVRKLGAITYTFKIRPDALRYTKTVHFYLLRYVRGSTDDHDDEVEQVAWVPIGEAPKQLHYENERRILRNAHHYLSAER